MTGQEVLAPLVLNILYIFMYVSMNVYVCGTQKSTLDVPQDTIHPVF